MQDQKEKQQRLETNAYNAKFKREADIKRKTTQRWTFGSIGKGKPDWNCYREMKELIEQEKEFLTVNGYRRGLFRG